MSNRFGASRQTIILFGVLGFSWIVALVALPAMPARLPTHWGLDGTADQYMNRLPAMLFPPVLGTLLAGLLRVLPRLDPRRRNYELFWPTYQWLMVALVLLLTAIQLMTIAIGLGYAVDVPTVITVLVGLLYIAVGNLLGKLRPTWFVGIRTPWTLQSSDVWTRTHRFGGRLLVLVGVVLVLAGLVLPSAITAIAVLGGIIGWAVVTLVYSYWIWRRLGGDNLDQDQNYVA